MVLWERILGDPEMASESDIKDENKLAEQGAW